MSTYGCLSVNYETTTARHVEARISQGPFLQEKPTPHYLNVAPRLVCEGLCGWVKDWDIAVVECLVCSVSGKILDCLLDHGDAQHDDEWQKGCHRAASMSPSVDKRLIAANGGHAQESSAAHCLAAV